MLAPPKVKFHWQLHSHYTVKEASNLHTSEVQFAYPTVLGDYSPTVERLLHVYGQGLGVRGSDWGDESKLWEDDSESDDSRTEDTGYETDLSTHIHRIMEVPRRVPVTGITPTFKKKKSIISQRNQRRKYIRSAAREGTALEDNVVFASNEDDDDDIFDHSG